MENMFIKIPNVMLVDGEEKVSGDELYLYYYLCLNELRWYRNTIRISVDSMGNHVKVLKNDDQNKNRIESLLYGLRDKKAIRFEDLSMDKFKYYKNIEITKQDESYYLNRNKNYQNGFQFIYLDTFDKVKHCKPNERGIYFYILCYIEKNKDKEITYEDWADVTGYESRQIKNIIRDMKNREMINVRSGLYYKTENNEVRQQPNQYDVIDCPTTVKNNDEINEKYKWYDEQCVVNDIIFRLLTDKENGEWVNIEKIDYMYAKEHRNDEGLKGFWSKKYIRLCKGKFKEILAQWDMEWNQAQQRKKTMKKDQWIDKIMSENGHAVELDNGEISTVWNVDWKNVKYLYYAKDETKTMREFDEDDIDLKMFISGEVGKFRKFDCDAVAEIGSKWMELNKK